MNLFPILVSAQLFTKVWCGGGGGNGGGVVLINISISVPVQTGPSMVWS